VDEHVSGSASEKQPGEAAEPAAADRENRGTAPLARVHESPHLRGLLRMAAAGFRICDLSRGSAIQPLRAAA